MPNVKFFFNHKLAGADFRKNKAWFEVKNGDVDGRPRETEVAFDLMLGADGAHSSVRYHMMKFTRMDYEQRYIDTLWCEFQIQPLPDHSEKAKADDPMSRFRISPNHLHIWPGKEFMFIAIPSDDGTFTCTLFAPGVHYARLEADPSAIPAFFDTHFPGVTALIPPADLIASFARNPHLPLITIKCSPHHFSSSVCLLGDAAHAMVPFYGQGMNAGLEDVRVLFEEFLDKFPRDDLERALDAYTAFRVPDAHGINDLALQNYTEMRAGVLSPAYRLRKALEEALSVYLPQLGWQTKYSRVSFSNERYSEVIARSEHQGKMLMRTFYGAVCGPLVIAAAVLWVKHRRTVEATVRGVVEAVAGLFRR